MLKNILMTAAAVLMSAQFVQADETHYCLIKAKPSNNLYVQVITIDTSNELPIPVETQYFVTGSQPMPSISSRDDIKHTSVTLVRDEETESLKESQLTLTVSTPNTDPDRRITGVVKIDDQPFENIVLDDSEALVKMLIEEYEMSEQEARDAIYGETTEILYCRHDEDED